MALQGTFDTLAITDVLSLLARRARTGTLVLDAEDVRATVRLRDGRCCETVLGDRPDPAQTVAERAGGLVDACFEVARRDAGSFAFTEEPITANGCEAEFEDAIPELERRLQRWGDVRSTLPSLGVVVRLAPELGDETVELDRLAWRVLVAIDGRARAEEVLDRSALPFLDGAEALAGLFRDGIAQIAEPSAPDASPPEVSVPDAPAVAAASAELEFPPETRPGTRGPRIDPDPESARTAPAPASELVDALHAVVDRGGDTEPVDDHDDVTAAPIEPGPDEEPGREGLGASEPAAVARDAAGAVGLLEEAGASDDELRDRGALLRLFSSIRDTP